MCRQVLQPWRSYACCKMKQVSDYARMHHALTLSPLNVIIAFMLCMCTSIRPNGGGLSTMSMYRIIGIFYTRTSSIIKIIIIFLLLLLFTPRCPHISSLSIILRERFRAAEPWCNTSSCHVTRCACQDHDKSNKGWRHILRCLGSLPIFGKQQHWK